jgi:hypothetical protein
VPKSPAQEKSLTATIAELTLRRVRILVFGVVVAAFVASARTVAEASSLASPPPHLTSVGRLTWELDSLMGKTFGSRQVCFDSKQSTLFAVSGRQCPLPIQRYLPYEYTFVRPTGSALRLVHLAREPLTGVTNVPVRVRHSYISCPNGAYHHGKRGWLVFGGGGPMPGSWFWCN